MPYLIIAIICGYTDHQTTKYAHGLGEHIRYLHLLLNLPAHLSEGRFYIPMSDLKLGELTLSDFMNPVTPDRIGKQIAYQCARIEKGITESAKQLPECDKAAMRPLTTLQLLASHTLALLKKKDYAVLDGAPTLTPLRKVWISWRQK